MTREVTLRRVGGSIRATPQGHGRAPAPTVGDRVLAVEADRGIRLTPYDPTTERALMSAAKAARGPRS
jgi:hypothetical protein